MHPILKLREVSIGYTVPALSSLKVLLFLESSMGVFNEKFKKLGCQKQNAYADPELGSFDGANSNAQRF